MGGVDIVDQRIAYYHPNLRCRRNWIPLFIQLLSMIRNNSFVVYFDCYRTDSRSQKEFAYDMVNELMLLAHKFFEIISPPTSITANASVAHPVTSTIASNDSCVLFNSEYETPSPQKRAHIPDPEECSRKAKRLRLVKADKFSLLSSFPQRKHRPYTIHVKADSTNTKRGSCVYCLALYSAKKNKGEEIIGRWDKHVKRTSKQCTYCKVDLCKQHFDLFHST